MGHSTPEPCPYQAPVRFVFHQSATGFPYPAGDTRTIACGSYRH
jgi:hypothetical protein